MAPPRIDRENDLTKVTVRICDKKHPHFRETGRLTGKIVTMKFGDGAPLAEMTLDDCKHGVDACFVSKGQIVVDSLQPRTR